MSKSQSSHILNSLCDPSDPGLLSVQRHDDGMARLQMQLDISETNRGYNYEFISLTMEAYELRAGDLVLAYQLMAAGRER